MKKNQYVTPELQVLNIGIQSMIAQSNVVGENGFTLNPSTMKGDDGSDAVKSSSDYNVWDDDWSR